MTSDAEASRALVVASACRPLRRALDPAAWVVFEELVLGAEARSDGAQVAATSVRHLARELGLGKDTVARALGRLIGASLVVRERARGAGGTFAAVRYVVRAVDGLTVVPCPTIETRPAGRARVRRVARSDLQPSLFGAEPDDHPYPPTTTPPTIPTDQPTNPATPIQHPAPTTNPTRQPPPTSRLTQWHRGCVNGAVNVARGGGGCA